MKPQNRVPPVFSVERAAGDLVDKERGLAGARAADEERMALALAEASAPPAVSTRG
jgi:hypothetical protein